MRPSVANLTRSGWERPAASGPALLQKGHGPPDGLGQITPRENCNSYEHSKKQLAGSEGYLKYADLRDSAFPYCDDYSSLFLCLWFRLRHDVTPLRLTPETLGALLTAFGFAVIIATKHPGAARLLGLG